MRNFHAYLSEPAFRPAAYLIVTGGTLPVDVEEADRLTIECNSGPRLDALVLACGEGTMTIAIAEGQTIELRPGPDGFEEMQLTEGFSRQCWIVV